MPLILSLAAAAAASYAKRPSRLPPSPAPCAALHLRPHDSQPWRRRFSRVSAQPTRTTRKARRPSRPAAVLASLASAAQELYAVAPAGKIDLSYRPLRPGRRAAERARPPLDQHLPEPVSLYSILARHLQQHASPQQLELEFQYTPPELRLLAAKGYTPASVLAWGAALNEPRSRLAASLFDPMHETPPLFVLLLFLRRSHIRVSALSVILSHLDHRVKYNAVSWPALKLLVIRLLRHARELWPESTPWIASLFTIQATRLHHDNNRSKPPSLHMLLDVTHFCNNILLLISLPASAHPLLASRYQEKAQVEILHYMANSSPAIAVSRLGFRSATRNQLAHAKTDQEREWAELKGPSWPPWKENRTAMDEDKGYNFGASRASRILHRMYEAGYGARIWEELAQVYAGWDTDLSPTIQTRTSMPNLSSQYKDGNHLKALLWAGRIRTTRTRREAWACFLSYETSGAPVHQEVYLAMFEKLHCNIAERPKHRNHQSNSDAVFREPTADLLPGDMKEVLPDPLSPLHHVFLSEPVPSYTQLLHRMHTKRLQPSHRLFAFLLETCPTFDLALALLSRVKIDAQGAIHCLVAGVHVNRSPVDHLPGYMFTAFIRCLCRFGRFDQPPSFPVHFLSPEQHEIQFHMNREYLFEYAYALLAHYRPRYRPAWTAYMSNIMRQKGSEIVRYKIMCNVLDFMDRLDIDVDDELFRLACVATLYAAQTADRGAASIEDARYIRTTGSSRIRTLFAGLVGANAELQLRSSTQADQKHVLPHVPGPTELHAYVRALSMLRDYEGLYSFSTWLSKHHTEVTARVEAQPSGSGLLSRTLVGLRAAIDGGCPEDIAQLIRAEVNSVEEWGGWPAQEYVDMYLKGHLHTPVPDIGSRK